MFNTIMKRRSIPLDELAEEIGVSQKTARRWVHCFSAIMQVEVRRGVVTVGDEAL